jgi:pyridoxine 5-phosphate synthase
MAAVKLSVNVDHVATLRQARRTSYPDPVEAARLAEAAGASGITVHLRADRRHIQLDDVERLRGSVRGKLNLELAATAEMLEVAGRVRPDQVSLVPERPEEVTTEGGLDLVHQGKRVLAAAERLAAVGIAVSLFLDPAEAQIEILAALTGRVRSLTEPSPVDGIELNTDAYTRSPDEEAAGERLAELNAAALLAARFGFHVYAGHGLTTANVGPVAALPGMEELNIGHALVSRAVLVGMEAAVREMLHAIAAAAPG